MTHFLSPPRALTFALLLLATLILPACSRVPPDTVARHFWVAALMGDQETAAALALPANFDADEFRAARYHQFFSQARIGEVDRDRKRARVRTQLEGYFDNIDFDTILVSHQRQWLVDYGATTQEMVAALLDESASLVNKDIQGKINTPDKDLGEAILEDWHNLDQTLRQD